MSGIYHDGIGSGLDESLHSVHGVACYAHTGCHAQTAFAILAGHRLILGLGNIFVSNQTYQATFFIHYRQFLNFVLLQNAGCGTQVSLLGSSHQVLRSHHQVDVLLQILFKTQIAIGHDAHQVSFGIHYRNSTNMVFIHQGQSISYF